MGRSRGDPENFAELVEIERASAQLHGRDPERAEETVRARLREIREKAEREAKYEAEKEAQRRWARWRPLVIGAWLIAGAALVSVIAFGVIWLLGRLERGEAFTAALDDVGAPFAALGLTRRDDWIDAEGTTITIAVPERTCSAVVVLAQGGTEPRAAKVVRPSGATEGEGVQLWCACGAEEVEVEVAAGDGHMALRWMTGGLDEVGGVYALEERAPQGASVHVMAGDDACSYAAAAAWAGSGERGEPVAFPDDLVNNERFVAQGAEPVGVFPPERRFVALRNEGETCHFAQPFGEGAVIVLRGADGKPIGEPTRGAFGWCNYGPATTLTLWREKDSTAAYALTRMTASRVGGLVGLGELAARQGHPKALLMLSGDDLNEDAKAALVASSVSAPTVVAATASGLPGVADHRIVAATVRLEATLSPADDVARACLPALVPEAAVSATLCVQAAATKWTASGPVGSWGGAEGELPVWLWELASGSPGGALTPDKLEAMASILALARRLHLAGFEPTSVDGVKDTIWGAEISPRGKSREVVAVGITANKAPWFHPLSDGEPWSLGGEPRVITMPAHGNLVVKAEKALSWDPKGRGAVVWRR